MAIEYLGGLLNKRTSISRLERVDVSHNNVSERACCMFANACTRSERLRWLKLDGNPLGLVPIQHVQCQAFT